MVGGFSECKVLQEAMNKEFAKHGLKIHVSNSAQLAVMKGAVVFGHTPTKVATRIARRSYGSLCSVPFLAAIHDINQMNYSDGIVLCHNIFSTFIEQGEEVFVGQTRELFTTRSRRDDEFVIDKLYAIDGKPTTPVQYTTDRRCQLVGKITTRSPPELKVMRLCTRTTMEFGGTEMKVSTEFIGTSFKSSTTVDFF